MTKKDTKKPNRSDFDGFDPKETPAPMTLPEKEDELVGFADATRDALGDRETISVQRGKQLIGTAGGIIERDLKTGKEEFVSAGVDGNVGYNDPEVFEQAARAIPKATKGRMVLFTFPLPHNKNWNDAEGQTATVPAVITEVWSDECVNLTVFVDGSRAALPKTSVPLKNTFNEQSGFYFEWPQY